MRKTNSAGFRIRFLPLLLVTLGLLFSSSSDATAGRAAPARIAKAKATTSKTIKSANTTANKPTRTSATSTKQGAALRCTRCLRATAESAKPSRAVEGRTAAIKVGIAERLKTSPKNISIRTSPVTTYWGESRAVTFKAKVPGRGTLAGKASSRRLMGAPGADTKVTTLEVTSR